LFNRNSQPEKGNLLPVIVLVLAVVISIGTFLAPGRVLATAELLCPSSFLAHVSAALLALGGGFLGWALLRSRKTMRIAAGIFAGMALTLLLAALCFDQTRTNSLMLLTVISTFLAGAGSGTRLLQLLRFKPAGAIERLALSLALGLGTLITLFFLLGQLGLFKAPLLLSLLLLTIIFCLRNLADLGRGFLSRSRRIIRNAGPLGNALLGLVAGICLLRLLHCFAPPLLGPGDYDALEYHAAAPLEWLRSGWVSFLAHNTYANMPAGAELLSAPALSFSGGPETVLAAGRLVSMGASLVSALLVWSATRRLAGSAAALLSAAMLLSGLWLSDLIVNPFIEPMLLMMTTAAWATFAAATARGRFSLSRLTACGLLAGFACTIKYPALIFVALPLLPTLILVGIMARRPAGEITRAAVLLSAGILLAAGPWYLRNGISSGNPVYPLAAKVFGSPQWSETRQANWQKAHAPPNRGGRPRSILTATSELLIGEKLNKNSQGAITNMDAAIRNIRSDPLLPAFLLLAIPGLWLLRRRGSICYALLSLWFLLGWGFFTHQMPRFIYPLFGIFCLLAGCSFILLPTRKFRRAATAVILSATICSLPAHLFLVRTLRCAPPLKVMLGTEPTAKRIQRMDVESAGDQHPSDLMISDSWRAIAAVNSLPEGSRIMLVGEVRPALFLHPTIYSTVWDPHPLEKIEKKCTLNEALVQLQCTGATHVFFNGYEFERLRKTYAHNQKDYGHLLVVLKRLDKRLLKAVEIPGISSQGRGALLLWKISSSWRLPVR
jgi:Dolichyl-phosphate-mannose-protein mannosyltransferase/Alg9-like mannosyltransferase family